jgi:hypothetical protein
VTPASGDLLLTPADAGERARDVLCVIDSDDNEPGAAYAVVLNRPLDEPAQPLAFGIFDCGEALLWWGGPTSEPFALARLEAPTEVDRVRPDGRPRRFLTDSTALFLPGRDHPPERPPGAVRLFVGSVWLSPHEALLYRDKGFVLRARDDVLFDSDPDGLADRLRASAHS